MYIEINRKIYKNIYNGNTILLVSDFQCMENVPDPEKCHNNVNDDVNNPIVIAINTSTTGSYLKPSKILNQISIISTLLDYIIWLYNMTIWYNLECHNVI